MITRASSDLGIYESMLKHKNWGSVSAAPKGRCWDLLLTFLHNELYTGRRREAFRSLASTMVLYVFLRVFSLPVCSSDLLLLGTAAAAAPA